MCLIEGLEVEVIFLIVDDGLWKIVKRDSVYVTSVVPGLVLIHHVVGR